MKVNIIFVIAVFTAMMTACNDESAEDVSTNTLVGTWKLTEVLADPGDGSGTYQPVESSQVIIIYGDYTFISTQRLCNGLYQGNPQNTGWVDVENALFWIDNCDFGPGSSTIGFAQVRDELYLYFACIEPCGQKYERLDGPSIFDN